MVKNKLNKQTPFNFGGIVFLIGSVYLMCHILIWDDVLPISIASMSCYFNRIASHWHFLAVALLPVYVALMIFGTAILGLYFGSALHNRIANLLKDGKKYKHPESKIL